MFDRVFGWYLVVVSGWPDLFGDLHQLLGITSFDWYLQWRWGTGTDTRRVFTTNDAKADRRYNHHDRLPRRVRAHRDASPSTHATLGGGGG